MIRYLLCRCSVWPINVSLGGWGRCGYCGTKPDPNLMFVNAADAHDHFQRTNGRESKVKSR